MEKKPINVESWLAMLLGDVAQAGQHSLITYGKDGYATLCWSAFGQMVRHVHMKPDVDVFDGMTIAHDGNVVRIYLKRQSLRMACTQNVVRIGGSLTFRLHPEEECTQFATIDVNDLKRYFKRVFCIPERYSLRLGKGNIKTFDRHLRSAINIGKLDSAARKRFRETKFAYMQLQCCRSHIDRWLNGDMQRPEIVAAAIAARFPDVAHALRA